MKNRRRISEKIAVVGITVLLCLILLESGLRILGRGASNISEGPFVQYRNFYRLKKNFHKVNNYSTFSFEIYTNSYGARDREIREFDISEKPYILFLGASQVFGEGVNFENSFVGILAEHANSKNIEVINLAVGGHFFLEQEAIFKEFVNIAERKPSLVVLGLSSATLNYFDESHSSQDSIIVKRGYLFYKSSWRRAYIKIMAKNTISLYNFFRDAFLKLNTKLNLFKSENRLPKHFELYRRTNRLSSEENAAKAADHLRCFERYCSENGIRLTYLFIPVIDSFRLLNVVEQLEENPKDFDPAFYEEFIVDYCRNNDQVLFNPRPLLKHHYEEGEQLMFESDPHYSVFANQVFGDYLIQEVFINNDFF